MNRGNSAAPVGARRANLAAALDGTNAHLVLGQISYVSHRLPRLRCRGKSSNPPEGCRKKEDTEIMSVEAMTETRSSQRTWLPVLVLTLIIAVPAFLVNPSFGLPPPTAPSPPLPKCPT